MKLRNFVSGKDKLNVESNEGPSGSHVPRSPRIAEESIVPNDLPQPPRELEVATHDLIAEGK